MAARLLYFITVWTALTIYRAAGTWGRNAAGAAQKEKLKLAMAQLDVNPGALAAEVHYDHAVVKDMRKLVGMPRPAPQATAASSASGQEAPATKAPSSASGQDDAPAPKAAPQPTESGHGPEVAASSELAPPGPPGASGGPAAQDLASEAPASGNGQDPTASADSGDSVHVTEEEFAAPAFDNVKDNPEQALHKAAASGHDVTRDLPQPAAPVAAPIAEDEATVADSTLPAMGGTETVTKTAAQEEGDL